MSDTLKAVTKAARELLDESNETGKLRQLVYAALHCDNDAGKEWAAQRLGKMFTGWLVNSPAMATKLGRIVDDDTSDPCKLSKQAQVYLHVYGSCLVRAELPTKAKTAQEAKIAERTVRECYRKIEERAGICLDERAAVNVWNTLRQDS